ncbi:unnamed protein product [Phytophthora fragariaefolia]|uniref:Unnamed protein product n=1 Tax=Phytophthora fragariaefolia TaxID=1490495 RepID=A0A9W6U9Z0_9STRA|nr:unnamed protein product [Phytophthora fragariaefolia]
MNLRDLFKVDGLRDQIEAPSLLWGRITAHFTKGDGVNPDYILRNLLNHELKPGQTVEAYVKKSEELVRRLRAANGELEEWEDSSFLLPTSQLVFRELAEQHTVWCSKNDRRSLTRADATQRLHQAEQARSQVADLQGGQPVQRAAQVVSFVSQGGKTSGKHNKMKRQGMSENELAQKKAKTKCNCSQPGHWYVECTAVTGKPLKAELADKLKAKNRKPATSFVGAVGVLQPDRVVQLVDVQVASPTYSPTTPASDDECELALQRLPARLVGHVGKGAGDQQSHALVAQQRGGHVQRGAAPALRADSQDERCYPRDTRGQRLEPGRTEGGSRGSPPPPVDRRDCPRWDVRGQRAMGNDYGYAGPPHPGQERSRSPQRGYYECARDAPFWPLWT